MRGRKSSREEPWDRAGRANALRSRFASVSSEAGLNKKPRKPVKPYIWSIVFLTLIGSAIAGYVGWELYRSPWPVMTTLKHWRAAPNCTAARAAGLAPARRGEPGYYPKHDADNDGVACEPWPRR